MIPRWSSRVQLITTLDGGEYVTPDQIEKELKDEIIVAGGRVKLTDVQPQLNVDLGHIQRWDMLGISLWHAIVC